MYRMRERNRKTRSESSFATIVARERATPAKRGRNKAQRDALARTEIAKDCMKLIDFSAFNAHAERQKISETPEPVKCAGASKLDADTSLEDCILGDGEQAIVKGVLASVEVDVTMDSSAQITRISRPFYLQHKT